MHLLSDTDMTKENPATKGGSGAHAAPETPRILVLGIGNVLLTDEGVGARVVEVLSNSFDFSDNVLLMDGGTLGLGLLNPIMEATSLVVIDAMHAGSHAGTIHRLTDGLPDCTLGCSNSLHEIGLAETLAAARMLDKQLEVVILGIEPEDIESWGTQLTETIQRRVPDLVAAALAEVERMGGRYASKGAVKPADAFR